jgi:hypothetical protein
MNETELRDAFRRTIAAGGPPARLDAAGMVRLGRGVRLRRRLALAVGATALTAGSAAGVVALLQVGGAGARTQPAGGQSGCSPASIAIQLPARPAPTEAPATASPPPPACPRPSLSTDTPWPSGQSDRTAHSGSREQRAQQVLARLAQVLPAGYRATSPWHQAQFDHWEGKTEVWEYAANVVATKGGRSGVLLVRVLSPSNQPRKDLCQLADYFYGPPATGCHVVAVNGSQVAIARHPAEQRNVGYSPDLDQWAVYRHPDGSVIWVGQAKAATGHGAGLTAPMFTEHQLARLATDPAFAG